MKSLRLLFISTTFLVAGSFTYTLGQDARLGRRETTIEDRYKTDAIAKILVNGPHQASVRSNLGSASLWQKCTVNVYKQEGNGRIDKIDQTFNYNGKWPAESPFNDRPQTNSAELFEFIPYYHEDNDWHGSKSIEVVKQTYEKGIRYLINVEDKGDNDFDDQIIELLVFFTK